MGDPQLSPGMNRMHGRPMRPGPQGGMGGMPMGMQNNYMGGMGNYDSMGGSRQV